MSLNEEIKKVIINGCKDQIEELSEVSLDDLSDSVILGEAWEALRLEENAENFNNTVNYIISNISDFTDTCTDDFIFINKISKTSLNATSIPFYDETSNTCLLYVDTDTDEIFDIDIEILSKILLNNFEEIISLNDGEVAIFQKKDVNEICLEDKETYSKVLLANIGLSIKDNIVVTKKTFLTSRHMTCNKNYLQYKDSIDILNKYNNTMDILWKYLLLYHILENFSYRRSISKSLRDTTSLNVKHLSSVYTSSKGEGEFIKGSIKKFLLKITNNTYFSDNQADGTIMSLELVSTGNANNLSKKIKLDNIDANVKDIAEFLNIELNKIDSKEVSGQEVGEIIYVVRNCLVHNKETEWIHINQSLLKEKPELKVFFEKFLLPTMEFIVKELIFKENDIIDYPPGKPNYILIWGSQPNTLVPEGNEAPVISPLQNQTSKWSRVKATMLRAKELVCSLC